MCKFLQKNRKKREKMVKIGQNRTSTLDPPRTPIFASKSALRSHVARMISRSPRPNDRILRGAPGGSIFGFFDDFLQIFANFSIFFQFFIKKCIIYKFMHDL